MKTKSYLSYPAIDISPDTHSSSPQQFPTNSSFGDTADLAPARFVAYTHKSV